MKIVDSLLIAPLAFCLFGALLGLVVDIRISQLCQGIVVASVIALTLHWLIGRFSRRRDPASARDRG